jgi:hypothetical protein
LYCTIKIVAGLTSSLVGGIAQDVLEKKNVGLQWLFFGGGVFMICGFCLSSVCETLLGVLIGSLFMGIGLGFGGFMAGGICVLWFEAVRGTMLLLAMLDQVIHLQQPVLPPNTTINSSHLHLLSQTNGGGDHLQRTCKTNNNKPKKVEVFVANLIAVLCLLVFIVRILYSVQTSQTP